MKIHRIQAIASALAAAAIALTGAAPRPANAAPLASSEPPAPVEVDVEIDPIAYVASGYSLHVGLGRGRYRLGLGAFAAALPQVFHGNDGFDVGMHGFGAKLDVFWRGERAGPFAGLEAGLVDLAVVDQASSTLDRGNRFLAGARIGWRFALPAAFYATPWVGVGYAFGASDRTIAGRPFSDSPLVVFPTLHVGRVF
jgi:hypothetical protein